MRTLAPAGAEISHAHGGATVSTAAPERLGAPAVEPPAGPAAPWRWLPLVAGVGYVAAVLLVADTAPADVARYAAYVALAVLLPGTLVYRALRRTPHTLVEDVAMGAAVGLALELPAWALFAALDQLGWLWTWPVAVVLPFAAVPALRRHWRPRGYAPVPVPWSWTVAGVVAFFTTYLSSTFLSRNPVLPTSDGTNQYLDLAYQLSLAGEAKHRFPIHVPQVAAEPLDYHWFGYAHMAATSIVGHIDLPVVALRLTIPALCAAAVVLTAVAGWRVSGKPLAGAAAAVLFWVVGETNFTHPVTMPFGTQASFVIWHGMSMIYSWVLLIALIAVLADVAAGRGARAAPALGRGALVLAALLLFASSGAKASSVPVVAVALLVTAVVVLVTQRRIPWAVVAAGLLAGAAQLFATAVLYRFRTYGVEWGPGWSFDRYWQRPPERSAAAHWLVVAAVVTAFLVNMQLRAAGILALLWRQRGRLAPVQVFLLAGGVAGPALYLLLKQPSDGNQYFTRAGFTFAVLLSGWGYALVLERARLGTRGAAALAAATGLLAVGLVVLQFRYAGGPPPGQAYAPLLPLLRWAALLAVAGCLVAAAWWAFSAGAPTLRGRGAAVALTAVLAVGAPGLIMDMRKSAQSPNGGAYAVVPMPKSRIDAARWARDNSSPDDVLATNVHCLSVTNGWCDTRSFWLSAYGERRVLVEGWAFAPRAGGNAYAPFWDQDLLARNDAAFRAPTVAGLRELRDRHGVRYLVVDRTVAPEAGELATLARRRFDNGRLAVYELPT
ncbi:MAG TPA: hypothetical protein VES42_19845 [Pilimelia sp.]|nr:hypothetical protein [Pilimelia sp.]